MSRLLRSLASLRLTLFGLLWLAGGLVADQNQWLPGGWAITPPLGLLSLNLAVALLVDARFRRRPALFAFHLCLLSLAILAGYGQLVTIHGRLPIVEGQAFAADLMEVVRAGPLAPAALPDGRWRQGAIEVDYAPGQRRGATRSRVWTPQRDWLEIGDDVPLIVDGYRFYTSPNKGFAALLVWLPHAGEAQLGAVHFPSYPATELGQIATWRTPGGQSLEMILALRSSPFDERWTLSSEVAGQANIELQVGERRLMLEPGSTIELDGGRLHYQRLAMWMGYEVRYDATLPWLFSLAALAVAFLAVHFSERLLRPARNAAVADDGCTA